MVLIAFPQNVLQLLIVAFTLNYPCYFQHLLLMVVATYHIIMFMHTTIVLIIKNKTEDTLNNKMYASRTCNFSQIKRRTTEVQQ